MPVSLTRSEYWILETVVDMGIQVRKLCHPECGESLNKTPLNESPSFTAELLISMQKRGWIQFKKPWQEQNEERICVLEFSEMVQLLDPSFHQFNSHSSQVYYYLTSLGGQIWEEFARPDWNRFVDYQGSCPEDNEENYEEITLISANKKNLLDYMHRCLGRSYEVITDSVIFEDLSPWQATYWKMLSKGVKVRFKCKVRELSQFEMLYADYFNRPSFLFDRWYTLKF